MGNRDTDRFGHAPSVLEDIVLERLLDGDDPWASPAPWDAVAALLSTVRAPATFGELTAEGPTLALYRSVAGDWRPRGGRSGGGTLTVKVGVAAGCLSVALLTATGAAAVGSLPPAAQRVAHAAFSAFGVHVPDAGPPPTADAPTAPGGVPIGAPPTAPLHAPPPWPVP
jgi:hypothetical protein